MKIKYPIYILFTILCMTCFFSHHIYAEETAYDLNQKKTVIITDKKSYSTTKEYTWLKYVPSEDGYLTLKVSHVDNVAGYAKGYVALYDSTKTNVLSSKNIFYNTQSSANSYWKKLHFGLLKNQTYYLRIKAENAVELSRTFTKTKDKSGALSIAALNLKKNTYKTGLIPAGTANVDWYKLTLKKKQKLKLYYQAKTNGSFRITIYMGNRLIGTKNIYYTSGAQKITLSQRVKSTNKKTGLNPGNYYIKVERANTISSGYYKIKWK